MSANPFALLRVLPTGKQQRKRLLFVCGAWRLVQEALREERSLLALHALEDLAESAGEARKNDVEWTAMQIEESLWPQVWAEDGRFQPGWGARTADLAATMLVGAAALDLGDVGVAADAEAEAERAAEKVLQEGATTAGAWTRRLAVLAACVRDLFGNPFRPVAINPAWQTPTVLALATAAYENRILPAGTLEPARLEVLADALEETGCDNADILNHCRQAGVHVRGCWVLDCLRGKE
jgi:hypothetical protein